LYQKLVINKTKTIKLKPLKKFLNFQCKMQTKYYKLNFSYQGKRPEFGHVIEKYIGIGS